ncbi:MAG TPA: hypothetical protein VII43_08160 [Opitutaceae bacterium]
MKHRTLCAALVLLLPSLSLGVDGARTIPDYPPIRIMINPEARVSVTTVEDFAPTAHPGVAVELPVKIVNQGFVTAALEAELVGGAPPGVALEFHPERLKGLPTEVRMLRITARFPGTIDVTIAFRAHNEIPDLGGRDRIHFLLRCE